jgi:hypothetical protein
MNKEGDNPLSLPGQCAATNIKLVLAYLKNQEHDLDLNASENPNYTDQNGLTAKPESVQNLICLCKVYRKKR